MKYDRHNSPLEQKSRSLLVSPPQRPFAHTTICFQREKQSARRRHRLVYKLSNIITRHSLNMKSTDPPTSSSEEDDVLRNDSERRSRTVRLDDQLTEDESMEGNTSLYSNSISASNSASWNIRGSHDGFYCRAPAEEIISVDHGFVTPQDGCWRQPTSTSFPSSAHNVE